MFAGQRAEPFFVDLGSVFDLGTLRKFQDLHLIKTAPAAGVDSLEKVNVHSLAIQVPIDDLTVDGSVPTDPMSPKAVIGVWGSARRRKGSMQSDDDNDSDRQGYRRGHRSTSGPWVQVSRLGMPLFNEVIVPLARKDEWNSRRPRQGQRLRPVREASRAGAPCCRCCTRTCSRT